jgi:hypothetical protein
VSGLPIPPNNEPLSTGERPSDIWWRYWEADSKALNALTTVVSALPISTASTFAQSILATTTASAARTVLGVDAADTVGTWTPEVALGGTTVAAGYTVQAGRYVRSDSGLVQAWGTITVTTLGVATSYLTIVGLPVAASNTQAGLKFQGMANAVGITHPASASDLACHVSTGATAIQFFNRGGGINAQVAVDNTQLSTALNLTVSVAYYTTV